MDLEKLLAPIAPENAVGPELRLEAGDRTYQRLDELRAEIDPALDPEGQGKEPNFKEVVRHCVTALESVTKDLQLAAYLTEGLARTEGFAGLAQGLRAVRELLAAFWDEIHPGVDEDGIDPPLRARWLSWLGSSGEFLNSLGGMQISPPGSEPLLWRDYLESEMLESLRGSNQTRFEELSRQGTPTREVWRARLQGCPVGHLAGIGEALGSAQAELRQLDALCEERFEDGDGPRLIQLRDRLEALASEIAAVTQPGGAPLPEQELGEAGAAPAGAAQGPIQNRADALQRLAEVAAYYRRSEPHSPVALLVERAVRWGQMPLEELLREVVKREDVLTEIWDTLGVKGSGEES